MIRKAVNEVRRRKSTSRVKLKTARKEERLQRWKEHFKNLLGNSSDITDKPTEKITNRHQTRRVYKGRTWHSTEKN